jgi:glutathione S-transferase
MFEILPLLFSFRRCPYAIRARMALHFAGLQVTIEEVDLKHKPSKMLAVSPKATVPVLILPNGTVLDESLDIMKWALSQNDPEQHLPNRSLIESSRKLIDQNDRDFKPKLDLYKYSDRNPQKTSEEYRKQGETFLRVLEDQLKQHRFLLGAKPSLADIAIFPFVRQFAHVDKDWFYQSSYLRVIDWLQGYLQSEDFKIVMKKSL